MTSRYATARAFRTALEERLKQRSLSEQIDLTRLRREVSFQRLLARLFADPAAPWLLKGGHAFELRLAHKARATKDIDLAIPYGADTDRVRGAGVQGLRDLLQDAVERDMGDWFRFLIGAPSANFDAPPEGGARFPVQARLDAREFIRFSIDIGIGDIVLGQPELIVGPNLLDFAGLEPAHIRVLPIEQQFAEKAHAYTLPRGTPNSRVKDLVDMLLIIELGPLSRDQMVAALQATFERRATHPLPSLPPAPPPEWAEPYEALAARHLPSYPTLESAYEALKAYWASLNVAGPG